MGAVDHARPGGERRAVESLDSEQVEPDNAADDVDQRVDRAKLVEMHFVYGRPVHDGLSLHKPMEHRTGFFLDRRVEARFLNRGDEALPASGTASLLIQLDGYEGAADAPPLSRLTR